MTRRDKEERINAVLEFGRLQSATAVAKEMPASDKIDDLLAGFDSEPLLSYRDRAKNSEPSKTSLWRLADEYDYHSYRCQERQVLSKDDMMKRHQFSLKMLEMQARNPRFFSNIWFSDECYFELGGSANTKNMYYISQINPEYRFEKPHRQKGEMVWVAVCEQGLIGPYVFEENVNAESYRQIIFDKFINELKRRYRNINQFFFQQDGAPAHYERGIRESLDEVFPRRWIGRQGPINWPARSPDLSPLDFWLWGILEDKVYKSDPETIEELDIAIARECGAITAQMCKAAVRSFEARLIKCRDSAGKQVEE
ncbi:MAG: putative transposable element tc3 transposase [Streblomastix strix]|uniref:Putative transposable element tc3 transposase n=1 Tax=Streblomastix strix TaxID=222440 RepID=A0A5J4WKU8_9EUKA|nr:MAG: putative transposable element tc3 transposase [Streblomastix strix]